MNKVLFFRNTDDYYKEEMNIAEKYFLCYESRVIIPNDSLVIGRYSVRPFYKDLEKDLAYKNCQLINTFFQHYFIANFNYYDFIKDYTPKTYFSLEEVPKDETKSFILKGRTNSRKHEWNTKMFAKGYLAAADLYLELQKDPLLENQGVIIRDYIPLKTLEIAINGLPITNEFRCFFYKDKLLTNFYYWCSMTEKVGLLDQKGLDFVNKIGKILADHLEFFVIDIAQKEDGEWTVIEVNDAQMSGCARENFDELYSNLYNQLNEQ